MNESGKQFYIPAVLATLLQQKEPDYSQCFRLAFQFEHDFRPDFTYYQYSIILKCMQYFVPMTDGGDGPVTACCIALKSYLDEWPIQLRDSLEKDEIG